MRIVTRPDFDGVVCAALLYEAETIDHAVKWVQPHKVQHSQVDIDKGDILANLPYDDRCTLWFDHHYSNKTDRTFEGDYRLAPSAARVVFDYYHGRFPRNFTPLVRMADRVDAADFSRKDVLSPQNDPYFLLSLTISEAMYGQGDEAYLNRLVCLFRRTDSDAVFDDAEVQARCRETIGHNDVFKKWVSSHAVLKGDISVVDFRSAYAMPNANPFLIFTIFPHTIANIDISYLDDRKTKVRINVGYNIFNPACRVNIGMMLSRFGGGGHAAAGGCVLDAAGADDRIDEILSILNANKTPEP
jgi:oligoribonuclease NrnB/cAMP/cGMP phosphodiesterase (DHH superfamily)